MYIVLPCITLVLNQFNIIKSRQLLQQTFSQDCDLIFSGSVCVEGSSQPLQKTSFSEGLRAMFDFEELRLTNRGPGNMVEAPTSKFDQIKRGPSFIGDEKSAFFNGNSYIEIMHDRQEFNTPVWTYSFWFFLLREGGGVSKAKSQCPVIHKGIDELNRPLYERYPGVYFNQRTRMFEVYVDQTTTDVTKERLTLLSAARIQQNKWVHIGVINTSSKIKFYVNGILDNIEVLESLPRFNKSPLFIGNVPWLMNDCSLKMYIDKLSYYNSEQKAFYLQAQSQPSLGMIEATSIHMGCVQCSIEQAAGSCIRGYHVCTQLEIYSGVYNLIRNVGWIEWDSNIWTYNMLFRQQEGTGETKQNQGTSICCID